MDTKEIKLTEKEKKTLIRIEYELCGADQNRFPEFPELTKEDIHKALKRLAELGLIEFDDIWRLSDKGEEYTTKNEELKELYDYFYKHI